jgi:hypothetical protein
MYMRMLEVVRCGVCCGLGWGRVGWRSLVGNSCSCEPETPSPLTPTTTRYAYTLFGVNHTFDATDPYAYDYDLDGWTGSSLGSCGGAAVLGGWYSLGGTDVVSKTFVDLPPHIALRIEGACCACVHMHACACCACAFYWGGGVCTLVHVMWALGVWCGACGAGLILTVDVVEMGMVTLAVSCFPPSHTHSPLSIASCVPCHRLLGANRHVQRACGWKHHRHV